MKKHRIRLLIFSVLLSLSTSPSQEMMKIYFNGHDYQIPNVFADSIKKAFAVQRPVMEALMKQYIEAEGGTAVSVWISPAISIKMTQKTFADIPNGHLGSGELLVTFSRATMHFDWASSCRIEAELMMRMTANIDIVLTDSSYQLSTSNIVMAGDVQVAGHSTVPWIGWFLDFNCEAVAGVFEAVSYFEFASTLRSLSTNIKQDILSFRRAGIGELPVVEAVQSFPIKFTFGSTVVDTLH
ncbi:MAG: hypothetical protein WEB33_02860 [Bacteroidota bacterium]